MANFLQAWMQRIWTEQVSKHTAWYNTSHKHKSESSGNRQAFYSITEMKTDLLLNNQHGLSWDYKLWYLLVINFFNCYYTKCNRVRIWNEPADSKLISPAVPSQHHNSCLEFWVRSNCYFWRGITEDATFERASAKVSLIGSQHAQDSTSHEQEGRKEAAGIQLGTTRSAVLILQLFQWKRFGLGCF